MSCTKKNPNKRAHDLNEEIKKILKQQQQDFFPISSYLNFSAFLQ